MRNKQREPLSGMQGFSDLLFGALDNCLLVAELSLDSLFKVDLHWRHDGDLSIELGLIVHNFGCKPCLIFGGRVSDHVDLSETALAHETSKLESFLK